MKLRTIALLPVVAAALTFGVTACGSSNHTTTATTPLPAVPSAVTATVDPHEPQGDARDAICRIAAAGQNTTTLEQAETVANQLWGFYAAAGDGQVAGEIKQLHSWYGTAVTHPDPGNADHNNRELISNAAFYSVSINNWCNGQG